MPLKISVVHYALICDGCGARHDGSFCPPSLGELGPPGWVCNPGPEGEDIVICYDCCARACDGDAIELS